MKIFSIVIVTLFMGVVFFTPSILPTYITPLLDAHNSYLASESAVVFVNPANNTYDRGEIFTIEVIVANVTNLYGVDIRFAWKPTILEYVSHTAKIPVETYPDGILHEPGMYIKNQVNATAGTYWLAYASWNPAPAFNGTGTAFNMTFRVKSVSVASALDIVRADLSDRGGYPISKQIIDGVFSSVHARFRFPLDGLWTVSQRFGRYSYDWTGYHLGEDVLRSFEAPVFAPADGVVKHNAKRTGYGYVVIIEHQLMDGTFVCSVLGHLREIGRPADVGLTVTKGQIVGYLSSVPEENGGILHLHYGIRKGAYSEELDTDGKWRYRGYGPIDIVGSWCPPSAFIDYYNLYKETPPSYNLTVSIDGNGTTIPAPGTYMLSANTSLNLIASSDQFQGWSGTDNDKFPLAVTMSTNRATTAIFRKSSLFVWPVPSLGYEGLIQDYGAINGFVHNYYHTGMDIGNMPNSPVVATADGEIMGVFRVGDGQLPSPDNNNMQNVVILRHILPGGKIVYSLYAHLADNSIPESLITGQSILAGTYLGATGVQLRDGRWVNHVHFEIKDEAVLYNPRFYPSDSQSFYWGYTPDHPYSYGYHDPVLFLHQAQFIYPEYIIVQVMTEKLNVRCGPHIEYPLQTEVHLGYAYATLGISTGTNGDWYQIWTNPNNPLGDNPDGWVAANYVSIVRPTFSLSCPADLIVTDPDGVTITKSVGEVPGMSYMELDTDLDGELNDVVVVSQRKTGNYLVAISPEPGASPSSTYTLEVSDDNTSIFLADKAKISEVPTDPYIITQNETAIMLRNINTAVTDVTPCKNVVGQGYPSSINVTVQNQGNLPETFNITVYANTTVIATFTDITLASGNSTALTFIWNTAGFDKGNYTISAVAHPVSGEAYTADNTVIGGWVLVTIPGDVDGDFDVDIYDVVKITNIYYSKAGDLEYKPNSDIDGDGIIDIYDVVRCTTHYGQHYP